MEGVQPSASQHEDLSEPSNLNINVRGILGPPTEILRLLEGFLQIKGYVVSGIYKLIDDNYDFLRSAYSVVVNNAGTIHSVSLGGVQILRSVLEFFIQILNEWEVTVPSISFRGTD